ncbi:MAG: hypothetical protein ACRDOI_06045 [Trebonia sp.]
MPISDVARPKPDRPGGAGTRPGWGRGLGLLGLVLAAALTLAGCDKTVASTDNAPLTTTSTDDGSLSSPSPSLVVLPSPSVSPSPSKAAVKVKAPVSVPTTHRATHRPSPTPARTTAAAKPSLCGAPQNPFGYNFCGRGGYIYSPAATVCDYFDCIANFGKSSGYMIECRDHTYSTAGGRSGACSYHGGKLQAVYSG